jgi:hypothetical protein
VPVETLAQWAETASYGGNPVHKRDPGDFGLTPPSGPRPGKTLCDGVHVLQRKQARDLLREGLLRGLVSEQELNGWPKNVWAVTAEGHPVEAILENRETGAYHGYPMTLHDPLREVVLDRWIQLGEVRPLEPNGEEPPRAAPAPGSQSG